MKKHLRAVVVMMILALAPVFSEDDEPFRERRLVTAPSGKFHVDWVEDGLALAAADRKEQPRALFPKPRELTGDEPEGMPLAFVSPDDRLVFVVWRDSSDLAELYTVGKGAALLPDYVTKERFDRLAWKFLAQQEKMDESAIAGGPGSEPSYGRKIAFAAWSEDGARLLVSLSAPLTEQPSDSVLRERGIGSWLCYFNVRTGEFELTDRLRDFNRDARKRWRNQYEQVGRENFPLEAEPPGRESWWLASDRFPKADGRLNELYAVLMKRLPPSDQAQLRQEQREWLIQRDTDALIYAHQSWSPAPEAALLEGKAIATEARVKQLEERGVNAGLHIVIREHSPDKQYAVRYTYRDNDFDEPRSVAQRIELIKLSSKEAVVEFDLQNEQDDLSFSVVWSPGSGRFATKMWIERDATTQVYQRDGETFKECTLPDFTKYDVTLKKGYEERKFLSGGEEPERWESDDVLVIKRFQNLMTDPSDEVKDNFRLRVRFTKDGVGTVEKVLSRKVTGPAR
jgi:Lysozyme inhibitor LprI